MNTTKKVLPEGAEGAKNELYPIFLKVNQLNIIIIGGGNVALEKLTFLLKSSPNAKVALIALDFSEEILALAKKHDVLTMQRPYTSNILHKQHIVIAATNDNVVNTQIYKDAKQKQLLVNVADTPHLCDFYLGGIVTKGNVKIAISTNGKSPTTAKRLRQFFEEVIPENIDDMVKNLNSYRKTIKGNFEAKVKTLNKLTEGLLN
ncbi:bifunctional precorrin-2 dehydrogenase/sirohydrochlorin ferrochelatase [Aureibaculum sp. 2210JD6-5]|uniref:precorrin-2 dehydrogenase/sirohydrochlorin ferrochelatase family protein n=1 Tax=Aureibaculum sp. 2210JD6-5 TaxID=3103957 RepID=UPI002AADB453|nr:bifunctional precorrin-2 dehydrogenase/sirohydrochlorin ferrochelatase [Aureibaculum sp. 2210JD6-5]MDY7395843.1 bifunctional precorrin-2 dehydrogenase/sirohydrochlorin ferrochelatase [Aureibaculum sp. 2210JD6-5]